MRHSHFIYTLSHTSKFTKKKICILWIVAKMENMQIELPSLRRPQNCFGSTAGKKHLVRTFSTPISRDQFLSVSAQIFTVCTFSKTFFHKLGMIWLGAENISLEIYERFCQHMKEKLFWVCSVFIFFLFNWTLDQVYQLLALDEYIKVMKTSVR